MIASINSVARSGGQILSRGRTSMRLWPTGHPRFAARWFDLAFITNAFGLAV
jgi:hypothetical protein